MKGDLLKVLKIFISEFSPWATIVFAIAAFYSWYEVIDSKKYEFLRVPITFSILAVLFLIVLIYNKFFRRRKKQG